MAEAQFVIAQVIHQMALGLARTSRAEDRATASRYLAELAPLLADAVLGNDVKPGAKSFNRHLGHTWLLDPTPFQPAIQAWVEFSDALGP